jgi:hypothetical protein
VYDVVIACSDRWFHSALYTHANFTHTHTHTHRLSDTISSSTVITTAAIGTNNSTTGTTGIGAISGTTGGSSGQTDIDAAASDSSTNSSVSTDTSNSSDSVQGSEDDDTAAFLSINGVSDDTIAAPAAASAAGANDLFGHDFNNSAALQGTDDDISYTDLFNDEHSSNVA